ncbi:MAG: AbgT family transporter [Melioribacteraceae bacterium]|nr:AbgT family transporter [Melioribacteraceae bacterium]MCF8266410.1 AbgT family transporter [Melioribacteraceae bacterium]MCF8413388.1 AbgT family transporter [Melioribacteraceae bacterium]
MAEIAKKGFFQKLLDGVERTGNKLPQPVTLFLILIFIVLFASFLASLFGVSAVHPGTGETIKAINLLSGEGIQRIFTSMVDVFAEFPPLGLVLVVMLGIGVAERTGLIAVALKSFVKGVPSKLITFSIVVAGMLSSLAADAGYVVLVPLGAAIFYGIGRHPIAGLAAAFAGVSGGFGANIFLTGLDPLLAAFTQSAAQILDKQYVVDATANWYIMAASVPFVGIAGTWVTEKILEPRLGEYKGKVETISNDDEATRELTTVEKKGLRWTGITVLLLVVAIAFMVIPEGAVFRDENGTLNPFFHSLVPWMMVIFFVPGLVYGLVTGSIKGDKDAADMTAESMSSMGAYIVLAFAAAQFVAFFNWSNMGLIVAITGADILKSVGFTGMPLIVAFVLVSSFINLLIGSASAKWAIMAPIFVPMLMLMGYSPELTQAAYRIGDSYSNILTPLLPYFPIIIVFAQKYDKNIGIGTLISAMLPYAIIFALVRIPMLIAWVWMKIPLGPDAPFNYVP